MIYLGVGGERRKEGEKEIIVENERSSVEKGRVVRQEKEKERERFEVPQVGDY